MNKSIQLKDLPDGKKFLWHGGEYKREGKSPYPSRVFVINYIGGCEVKSHISEAEMVEVLDGGD